MRNPSQLTRVFPATVLIGLAGNAMAQSTDPGAPSAAAEVAVSKAAPPVVQGPKAWRLSSALGLPAWLDISGEQRTRYETLDGQFRRGLGGSDQGLFFRTRLKVTAKKDNLEGTFELLDARQELSDSGSPLTTSEVNAAEALQAYGALHFGDALLSSDKLMVQAGRITMDIGSRRLICRSNYSNAPQAFTGVNAIWTAGSGSTLQAFAVLPVTRLPADKQSLLSNNVALDHEDFDVFFAGVHGKWAKALAGADLEGYIYGLQEDDDDDNATRNRELGTTGVRLYAKPTTGKFDYDIEPMLQFGHSRLSAAASDTRDLDHLAYAVRFITGYTFEGTEKFRVALEGDYASGDHGPTDGKNQRFDPLYGDRRADFGPTGIYGPLSRGNLIAVGPRFSFKPTESTDFAVVDKLYWLADSTDAWVPPNVQDTTGNSGRYLGNQPELVFGWDVVPGNLRLEAGAAYLFAGDFAKDAPNSTDEGDASYIFFQSTVTF